jgi:hypothetical protein
MSMQDSWIGALEKLTCGKLYEFPATRQLRTTLIQPAETSNHWLLSRRQVDMIRGRGFDPSECTAGLDLGYLVVRHPNSETPVLMERCRA